MNKENLLAPKEFYFLLECGEEYHQLYCFQDSKAREVFVESLEHISVLFAEGQFEEAGIPAYLWRSTLN